MSTRPLAPALLLFLAACASEPDPPGALTTDDRRDLNEAAEMLDTDSVTPAAVANESPAP